MDVCIAHVRTFVEGEMIIRALFAVAVVMSASVSAWILSEKSDTVELRQLKNIRATLSIILIVLTMIYLSP